MSSTAAGAGKTTFSMAEAGADHMIGGRGETTRFIFDNPGDTLTELPGGGKRQPY